MIVIVTALHWEAKPFLEHFSLKKIMQPLPFEVFRNQELTIVVSGIGRLAAAAATSFALTRLLDQRELLSLVNVGVCGSADREALGKLHVINALHDRESNRSFFPDMVLRSGLPERRLETFEKAVTTDDALAQEKALVDMEGTAIFETAARFLGPERISLFKIPSDQLVCGALSESYVVDLLRPHMQTFARIFEQIQALPALRAIILSPQEEQQVQQLAEALSFTESQRRQLFDAVYSYRLHGGESLDVLKEFSELTPETKNASKEHLRDIQASLASA